VSDHNFIIIPARLGKEANLADNDVWPGDLVKVNIRSLANEAARICAERMIKAMDAEILAAFKAGFDYVVVEAGPVPADDWTVTFGFKGRPSQPGEFDGGLPYGWRLYRLKDWADQR